MTRSIQLGSSEQRTTDGAKVATQTRGATTVADLAISNRTAGAELRRRKKNSHTGRTKWLRLPWLGRVVLVEPMDAGIVRRAYTAKGEMIDFVIRTWLEKRM